jgi:spermidine synthase
MGFGPHFQPAKRTPVMKFFEKKSAPPTFDIISRTRSRFNEIYVIKNGDHREMWFKEGGQFFLQSRLNLENRNSLVLINTKLMLASLLFQSSPARILMLGLGGGSIPNFLHHVFPDTRIDVVEVDPNVIDISRRFFNLRETENYKIHPMDARIFIQSQIGKNSYDLIFLDAFKSGSVPFHLKTEEFYREILEVLSPDGVVASNLYGKSNLLKPSDRTTFETLFSNLYFFEDPDQVATVLIATNQERFWTEGDIRRAGDAFDSNVSLSMPELATMYRPGLLGASDAKKFHDDFEAKDFRRTVEENNTHRGKKIQYPIKSFS